jgi:hypothetical protein
MQAVELTDRHLEILGGGVVFLGTVDRAGRPDCARCFGAKVHDDRKTVRLLLPVPWSATPIANLRDGGWIAFSFTDPITYHSFQAKGRVLSIEAPTDEDVTIAKRHLHQFADNVISVGVHESSRLYVSTPTAAITFRIERLYCQTPGPGAGDPVGGAS